MIVCVGPARIESALTILKEQTRKDIRRESQAALLVCQVTQSHTSEYMALRELVGDMREQIKTCTYQGLCMSQ